MGKLPKGFINTKKLAKVLEDEWYHTMKDIGGFIHWDGQFTEPVVENRYRVSLCTTCMDRLDNLKQTLPQNMKDNEDYNNVEFVVLDYNSRKDDVWGWMKNEMMPHIESGKIVYYRTQEPKHFDMAHSRNIAFKLATGDVVNNVDADAFTPYSKQWDCGFASFINKLAHQQPEKAIFAKSRQLLRGRLGFYRREFIDILGGYDEQNLHYYGHDDADLMNRAWKLGFKMMSYSGGKNFCGVVPNHIKHQEGNYPEPWWMSEGKNRLKSYTNLICGEYVANKDIVWAKAKVIKNFEEEIEVGIKGKNLIKTEK